jgi:hypothetical protein
MQCPRPAGAEQFSLLQSLHLNIGVGGSGGRALLLHGCLVLQMGSPCQSTELEDLWAHVLTLWVGRKLQDNTIKSLKEQGWLTA